VHVHPLLRSSLSKTCPRRRGGGGRGKGEAGAAGPPRRTLAAAADGVAFRVTRYWTDRRVACPRYSDDGQRRPRPLMVVSPRSWARRSINTDNAARSGWVSANHSTSGFFDAGHMKHADCLVVRSLRHVAAASGPPGMRMGKRRPQSGVPFRSGDHRFGEDRFAEAADEMWMVDRDEDRRALMKSDDGKNGGRNVAVPKMCGMGELQVASRRSRGFR
jgi:hypothetical protein